MRGEHFVLLTNGYPGLRKLVVLVNGKRFTERDLQPGQQATLDVEAAMQTGTNNTIRLFGFGKRDASAEVLISDQP